MKKLKLIIIFLIPILFICGCDKKEEKKEKKKEEKQEVIVKEPEYQDSNNTPISIYSLRGNQLVKLTEDTKNLQVLDDIGLFQIYPSNEDTITINSFGSDFYNEFSKYNTNNNLKIGFNITFETTTNETISYNILGPNNTFDKWEYLMNYLYDDYANMGKSFYSHIEEQDLHEDTLFTAIKMQCGGKINEIKDKIELTVFTYDTEDDFLDGKYRGNSKYTYTIKKSN